MAESIQVRTFGEFSMTYNGNTVNDQDNRSKKSWTIIEYLVTNHTRSITQSQLIELLWTEDNIGDAPENALKTCLHRARDVLTKLDYPGASKMILHKRGTFSWNGDIPLETDFDLFEHCCTVAGDKEYSDEVRIENYKKALELYSGDFLPKCSSDDWAAPVVTYYHSLFVKMAHDYLAMLDEKQMYQDMVDCCCHATTIDGYDELIHYYFILGLYKLGKQKKALERYESVMSLFYNNYGINPSEKFITLHEEILKSENSFEADLSVIQNDLVDQAAIKGAFYCQYGVFKQLYRLEARSVERSGQSIYLCLITLNVPASLDDNKPLATAMTRMQQVITHSLRTGDPFARYSKNQYVIMLPSACYENSIMIGERILKNYDNSKPRLAIRASFAVKHLKPQQYIDDVAKPSETE